MENNLSAHGKERSSNLELFRIITMFFIVLHHYVVNSELLSEGGVILTAPLSLHSIILLLLSAWGKTGINCFVIISGFFMCKSHITAKKFLKLFGEIMFYRIIIYLVFLISGYEPFSVKSFILTIIPVIEIGDNFEECYLIFFLFIPFINLLINAASEKQNIYLLLLCGFVYVFLGTLHKITFNYVSWFIIVYIAGAYIRMYPKKIYSNVRLWGLITAVLIALLAAGVVICTWVWEKTGKLSPYSLAVDSNSLLPCMIGISSFIFFNNLRIKQSRLINTIAASTFGVLLIHANSATMRRWLWKDLLDNSSHYNSPFFLLHALGSAAGIFIICVLIDKIRIALVEKPFFRLWDKKKDSLEKWFKLSEEKILNKLDIKNE